MSTIVIIGSGIVGTTLATGFKKHGHSVVIATRSEKVENWDGPIGKAIDVLPGADIVVLAVKGTAAESVITEYAQLLKGRIVIDVTNPISDTPPTNGVIHYFTTLEESLMERLQRLAPDAKFVKAFNSVGNALMVNPALDQKPSMFICGNDREAKQTVASIADQFGWEVEDMGAAEAARAIEPLCMLWCIPGFLHNDWSHAFKLLR